MTCFRRFDDFKFNTVSEIRTMKLKNQLLMICELKYDKCLVVKPSILLKVKSLYFFIRAAEEINSTISHWIHWTSFDFDSSLNWRKQREWIYCYTVFTSIAFFQSPTYISSKVQCKCIVLFLIVLNILYWLDRFDVVWEFGEIVAIAANNLNCSYRSHHLLLMFTTICVSIARTFAIFRP